MKMQNVLRAQKKGKLASDDKCMAWYDWAAITTITHVGVVKAVLKTAGSHLKVDDVIVEFE